MFDGIRDHLAAWIPFIALGGIIVFFFLLILITACLEKLRVREYDAAGNEVLNNTSAYFSAMNAAAQAVGFQFCGVFAQNRNSKTYQCRMALWLLPDKNSMAAVVGGKISKFNYRKTFLISQFGDGTAMVTVDDFGVEDLSGLWDMEVLKNADFLELASRHSVRLSSSTKQPVAFSPDRALREYEALKAARVDQIVSLGLGQYLDGEHNVWRHTFRGAFKYTVKGYLKGLVAAQRQMARASKKRPGD